MEIGEQEVGSGDWGMGSGEWIVGSWEWRVERGERREESGEWGVGKFPLCIWNSFDTVEIAFELWVYHFVCGDA